MIKMENHLGTIEISEQFFISLIGDALSDSFGVAGLAPVRPRKITRDLVYPAAEERRDPGKKWQAGD